MKNSRFFLIFVFLLAGCAGPNPNPGERTTDMAWMQAQYTHAFNTALPHAESGKPWAQLRIAIFYHNGWGVEKNSAEAAKWYEKATKSHGDDGWSEGNMIGAVGESGYFNQNSDALIARYNLAEMYYKGDGVDKNLGLALKYVNEVIDGSKGNPVFFCCEFSQSRFFTQEQFIDLRDKVKKNLAGS